MQGSNRSWLFVGFFWGACSAPPFLPSTDGGSCVGDACALEDAGSFGSCSKCGQPCGSQAGCLAQSFDFDEPLPQCQRGTCQAMHESIDLRFEVDTQYWAGLSTGLGSLNTRFVLGRALDGGSVGCKELSALTAGSSPNGAELETSGKLNLLAFDVSRIRAPAGSVITQPYLPVGIGGDFVIWTELWSGPPSADTKLPSGLRLGVGCFDSGDSVSEIRSEQHWPSTGATPTSRTIRVLMPPPR